MREDRIYDDEGHIIQEYVPQDSWSDDDSHESEPLFDSEAPKASDIKQEVDGIVIDSIENVI